MNRPTRRRLGLLFLAGAAALAVFLAFTRPPARYSVRGVAMDEGSTSRATGLNNRGEILGDIDHCSLTSHRVFVELGGHRNVICIPGKNVVPRSIIDTGDFVCQRDGQKNLQLVLWRDGRLIEPMAHGVSLINGCLAPDGTVAGTIVLSKGASYASRAVLWRDGRVTDLSVKGISTRENNMALAMNAAGLVVGIADRESVLWRDGRVQSLPRLPGHDKSIAVAVNEQEQIIGVCHTTGPLLAHRACLWESGTLRDLGSPGGDSSVTDINASGQVIGYSIQRNRPHVDWSAWRTPALMLSFTRIKRATLFEGGKAQDLNRLIPRRSGWRLRTAAAINDRGQIVGTGRYRGQERGYVLTPLPSR